MLMILLPQPKAKKLSVKSAGYSYMPWMMFSGHSLWMMRRHGTNWSPSKILAVGDCSWGTMKQVLGWVINTVTMTICLPQHCINRLEAILNAFLPSQQHTGVKCWHEMLGEL
jgi:hypothetical protein